MSRTGSGAFAREPTGEARVVDDGRWPLVFVRWEGSIDDAMLATFLHHLDNWLAREERFGLLIDSRGARGFSPEQRTRVLNHMKSRADRTRRLLVQAVVIDNLIQRTLFQWINLLFPNPFPSKIFAQPDPARQWLEEMLRGPG